MRKLGVLVFGVLGGLIAAGCIAPTAAQAPDSGLTPTQATACREAFQLVNGYTTEMIVFGYEPGVTDPALWANTADQRVAEFGAAYNAAIIECPLAGD